MARKDDIQIALVMLVVTLGMAAGLAWLSHTSKPNHAPLSESARQQESIELEERIQRAMLNMEQSNE